MKSPFLPLLTLLQTHPTAFFVGGTIMCLLLAMAFRLFRNETDSIVYKGLWMAAQYIAMGVAFTAFVFFLVFGWGEIFGYTSLPR